MSQDTTTDTEAAIDEVLGRIAAALDRLEALEARFAAWEIPDAEAV
jgi:hypothetical protein